MPRFTEQEKEIISSKLLIEGEKLFALHGLKKVTVDDLVAAVNISKGSFYAFYPSKEHLYVEISFRLQKELFASIEATIKKKKYKKFSKGRYYAKFKGFDYFTYSFAD